MVYRDFEEDSKHISSSNKRILHEKIWGSMSEIWIDRVEGRDH